MSKLDEAVRDLQLVEVFEAGDYDYSWNIFKGWKAPSGRFLWYSESGCSCYYFGADFGGIADFGDGDRDALERAFREWAGAGNGLGHTSTQEVIDGVEKLRQL